jgi:hypothetical protein
MTQLVTWLDNSGSTPGIYKYFFLFSAHLAHHYFSLNIQRSGYYGILAEVTRMSDADQSTPFPVDRIFFLPKFFHDLVFKQGRNFILILTTQTIGLYLIN